MNSLIELELCMRKIIPAEIIDIIKLMMMEYHVDNLLRNANNYTDYHIGIFRNKVMSFLLIEDEDQQRLYEVQSIAICKSIHHPRPSFYIAYGIMTQVVALTDILQN